LVGVSVGVSVGVAVDVGVSGTEGVDVHVAARIRISPLSSYVSHSISVPTGTVICFDAQSPSGGFLSVPPEAFGTGSGVPST
jgi:hypothetical protein